MPVDTPVPLCGTKQLSPGPFGFAQGRLSVLGRRNINPEPASAGGTPAVSLSDPDQPLERRLIRIVILPVAEVGDEVLANLARRVDAPVGVEQRPLRKGASVMRPMLLHQITAP